MYECSMSSNGACVRYESNRTLLPIFESLVKKPEFQELTVQYPPCKSSYAIRFEEASQVGIKYSKRRATISGPLQCLRNGETLLYAALPFFERQNQSNGFLTAHAAAVDWGGQGILLLGKEGSGKTSTALELCRSFGAGLIGNDLVAIGKEPGVEGISAKSGTKFLSLRFESMRRNLPGLLNLFPSSNEDPWLRKVVTSPYDAGIRVVTHRSKIVASYMVHVDDTKSVLNVLAADNVITRLYLNENFSRYIRATCIALLGDNLGFLGYVPSFDSQTLFDLRCLIIEALLQNMKYVSGSLSAVAEYIAHQTKIQH